MVDAVCYEEKGIHPHKQRCIPDHPAVIRKNSGCLRGKNDQDQGNDKSNSDRQQDYIFCSLLRTFFLPGAYVLADKGRSRNGHALHGQKDELIQFVIAAPPGHTRGAEYIDIGLYKHIGKCRDRRLDRSRKANGQDHAEGRGIHPEIPPDKLIDILRPCQQRQYQNR